MRELQAELKRLAGRIDGRFSVCVRDLATGEEISVNADEPLPMASVCKIPILVTAYREHEAGRFDMAERVDLTDATRCFGSGLFNAFDAGLRPTLHDLLLMMIVVSDNASTDLVLDRLTPALVTQTMRHLGHETIRVDRPIRDLIGDILAALDPKMKGLPFCDWDAFMEANPEIKAKEHDLDEARRAVNETAADRDTATTAGMARLCGQIARNECASEESCAAMLDILDKQLLNGRLPRDLPAFTKFPHKTGTLGSGAVVNDAGILYLNEAPVATVAVLSRDVRNPIHETSGVMAAVGRAVYDYYFNKTSSGKA